MSDLAGIDHGKTEIEVDRQYYRRLSLVALALGVIIELLFFEHSPGLSFPIWALCSIAALLGIAASISLRPSRSGWLLPIPILFFSAQIYLRQEPLVIALSVLLSLWLFGLWIQSFRGGRLLSYGWLDLAAAFFLVPLNSLLLAWAPLRRSLGELFGAGGGRRKLYAVLRGVLLAIPVVAVFVALLSSADLIFSGYVDDALRWLDLERIGELVARGLLIAASTIFVLGSLVMALRRRDQSLMREGQPFFEPFLGITESAIVLGAVNLLFLAFVVIQFTYLFGGQANISSAGFTYADYARRGFGELVAVSLLSLGMILVLGAWTKRSSRGEELVFRLQSALLVVLVGVILGSALLRLQLYEAAYGFTRLRTYTHILILWMAAAFLVFLVLLFLNRLRSIPAAAMLVLLGFAATLSFFRVDPFIVGANSARYAQSGSIDAAYLLSLSDEAIPGLVRLAQQAPLDLRRDVLPELACRRAMLEENQASVGWQSLNLPQQQARQALERIEPQLMLFPTQQDEWGNWQVEVGDELRYCGAGDWMD